MTPVRNLSQPLILENGELLVAQNYTMSVVLAGLPVWSIKFKVTVTFFFFSSLSLYLMSIFLILQSSKTDAEVVQMTYTKSLIRRVSVKI